MRDKIRAFIALKPPPSWEEHLRELQARLREDLRHSNVKWVRVDQIHITLRFFGTIAPDLVSTVTQKMEQVAAEFSAFEVATGDFGCFPSVSRPRVFWIGLRDAGRQLAQIHNRVAEETTGVGKPAEGREFTPHLTLARINELDRRDSALFSKAMGADGKIDLKWPVSEILLLQSHLAPSGSTYDVLHASRFAASRDEL